MPRFRLLFAILALSALVRPTSAEVELISGVVANGGERGSNTEHTVTATAGQTTIGPTSGDDHVTEWGFWYQTVDGAASGFDWPLENYPAEFSLRIGPPNPVRSQMTLWYSVPQNAQISVRLYDVRGREVRTLFEGDQAPGEHRIAISASGLASGIYFCRMDTEGFSATRRLVLLR